MINVRQGSPYAEKLVDVMKRAAVLTRKRDTGSSWFLDADLTRGLLSSGLAAGLSINQRLKRHADIAAVLVGASTDYPPARTLHSVKGMEFPAVCVVMTSQKAGKILDLREGGPSDADEDARKACVGASRAERLLAFAVPNGSAGRLIALLVFLMPSTFGTHFGECSASHAWSPPAVRGSNQA